MSLSGSGIEREGRTDVGERFIVCSLLCAANSEQVQGTKVL
jgi:hypothetical protein